VGFSLVVAGLVLSDFGEAEVADTTPLGDALYPPKRDHRDKPGDDKSGWDTFVFKNMVGIMRESLGE